MKTQELQVTCIYTEDGPDIQDVINASFSLFLRRELEFPEIREFVKSFDNVEWVKPTQTFVEVISKYGYPIISKQVSLRVYQATHSRTQNTAAWEMFNNCYKPLKDGSPSHYNIPKWKFLLDADFRIHNKCCDVMKKSSFAQL